MHYAVVDLTTRFVWQEDDEGDTKALDRNQVFGKENIELLLTFLWIFITTNKVAVENAKLKKHIITGTHKEIKEKIATLSNNKKD